MGTDRLLIVAALLALVLVAVVVRRQRSARPRVFPKRVDPLQLGLNASYGDTAVVAFSGPLCHACQEWGAELADAGIPYRKVDVLKEAGLARAYGVTSTPLILVINRATGSVLLGYSEGPNAASISSVRALVVA